MAAGSNITGRYDSETAVYDISAHVVYLPDGTRLEAHSGYGSMLDDPRHADAKDRGVTPPDLYDLELREAPFHGVRALRLKPVDESKVFGRSGLLAHTFMLGPNGDSNGCVSFRNYEPSCRPISDTEIKKLAVVARWISRYRTVVASRMLAAACRGHSIPMAMRCPGHRNLMVVQVF